MNCRIFEDLSLLVIGVLGLGSEVLSKADARGLWELDLSALAAGVADGTVSVLRLASGLIHIRLVVLASREVAVVRRSVGLHGDVNTVVQALGNTETRGLAAEGSLRGVGAASTGVAHGQARSGTSFVVRRKVNILVGPSRKPDEATASDDAGSNGGGDSSHDVHSGVEVQEKEDGGHAVGGESDDEVDDTVLEEEGPEIGATRSPDETNGGHRQDEEIVTHGVNVDQVQEDRQSVRNNARSGNVGVHRVDSDHTVEEDSPLAKCKNDERDDNHKIPAPNRDGAEHQEGRSRRNGNVAHQLIEDVERLAVQPRSRIEGDVNANEREEKRVTTGEVETHRILELSLAAEDRPIVGESDDNLPANDADADEHQL